MTRILHYVHDPMCSWCWAFRPIWERIVQGLPDDIRPHRLLGGLAPDSDLPMTLEMQTYLQKTWRTIEQRVPGTRFNFAFWEECQPRRSTYPACRAVICAKYQGMESEEPMIQAIQQAYYLQARNPSDDDTLITLAGELGLDTRKFANELHSEPTRQILESEIALGLRMGARGFPSLILESGGSHLVLRYDYRNPEVVLRQLTKPQFLAQ